MQQSRSSQRRHAVVYNEDAGGFEPARQSGSSGPRNNATARSTREYMPVSAGEKAGNSIGALEAEYFGCMFLIFLTVFTDGSASYASKMLAVMKRGTLATVLFFILALFSASGPNAARFSKAMGALVIAGIFLSTAGQGSISALDSFFKANWATGDTTQGDTSANSALGTQTSTGAASLGTEVEQAAGVPGNVISETIDGVKHVYVDVNGLGQNILKSLGL